MFHPVANFVFLSSGHLSAISVLVETRACESVFPKSTLQCFLFATSVCGEDTARLRNKERARKPQFTRFTNRARALNGNKTSVSACLELFNRFDLCRTVSTSS